MPLISTSTVSPGVSQRGGVRAKPTPLGVPVAMMSPGFSAQKLEQYSMMRRTPKHRSLTGACCSTSPFTRVASRSAAGSGISSVVTSHGPQPPVAGKFLPGVNWVVCRCQSRTEPSRKQV